MLDVYIYYYIFKFLINFKTLSGHFIKNTMGISKSLQVTNIFLLKICKFAVVSKKLFGSKSIKATTTRISSACSAYIFLLHLAITYAFKNIHGCFISFLNRRHSYILPTAADNKRNKQHLVFSLTIVSNLSVLPPSTMQTRYSKVSNINSRVLPL